MQNIKTGEKQSLMDICMLGYANSSAYLQLMKDNGIYEVPGELTAGNNLLVNMDSDLVDVNAKRVLDEKSNLPLATMPKTVTVLLASESTLLTINGNAFEL